MKYKTIFFYKNEPVKELVFDACNIDCARTKLRCMIDHGDGIPGNWDRHSPVEPVVENLN